ncbi:MAG: PAS domain-containing protein [Spirochaetia bacterium]|nr:PAS domain-containing protein [Spirochaetia bacterium]
MKKARSPRRKKIGAEIRRLRAVEKRFLEMVNHFPGGGFGIMNLDLSLSFVAGQELNRMELGPDYFLGKKPADYLGAEAYESVRHHYEAAQNGQSATYELSFQGSTFLTHLSPIRDKDGNMEQILALILNIDQVKEAQKRSLENERLYQKLAENFPNGLVVVYNRDLLVTFIAGEELRSRGADAKMFIGRHARDIGSEESYQVVGPHLEAALLGKSGTYQVAFEDQFYLSHTAPLWNDKGEVEQILLSSLNITQIKAAERELQKALAREKELHELKSRFITIVSHEFRTPLTTILSSAELIALLGDNLTQEKRIEYLDRIKRGVGRMTALLNNILFLEKTQGKKLPFRPSASRLKPVLENLVNETNGNHDHSHRISLQCRGLDGDIGIDLHLVEPIVANLLSNAVKYSKPGSAVLLDVEYRGEDLVIRVEDEGIGIPSPEQIQLFNSFFRASNVGGIHGIGLGLSIVKQCAEAHGGTVELDSQENRGSRFRVLLPAALSDIEQID